MDFNKNKGELMSLEVLILESVGACVDTNGVTYPLQVNRSGLINYQMMIIHHF